MNPNRHESGIWQHCETCFHRQHAILWPTLSRTANLLVILNVSLFFLTDEVRTGGYYFPVISLGILAAATFLVLLPLGWHSRLGFYLFLLSLHLAAGWFLGASILYWIRTGSPS